MFDNRYLTCRECGAEFVFTTDEQAFFLSKGFENQPTRCPTCRIVRRTQSNLETPSNIGNPQIFEVPCQQCGNIAQVPFQPDGRKPVLCRECTERLRYR